MPVLEKGALICSVCAATAIVPELVTRFTPLPPIVETLPAVTARITPPARLLIVPLARLKVDPPRLIAPELKSAQEVGEKPDVATLRTPVGAMETVPSPAIAPDAKSRLPVRMRFPWPVIDPLDIRMSLPAKVVVPFSRCGPKQYRSGRVR